MEVKTTLGTFGYDHIVWRMRSFDVTRLHVQQHAREKYQTIHVRGPLMRLAAVLHRRRVLSCEIK